MCENLGISSGFGGSLRSLWYCMLGENLLSSGFKFAYKVWVFIKGLLVSRNLHLLFPRAGEMTHHSGVWKKELGMSSSVHYFLWRACILPCPFTL